MACEAKGMSIDKTCVRKKI